LPILSRSDLLGRYKLPEKYVLLSFNMRYLQNIYIKKLEAILKSKGYTAIAFPMPEGLKDYGLSYKIGIPLSPLDWYYLIKYASGYIGERMHPILVALHNAVPFFCFDHYGLTEYNIPIVSKLNIPFISKYDKNFIWATSKIYHILSKADLLSNVVSYKNHKKLTPLEVVNRLLTFDLEKAVLFSIKYQKLYEKSMCDILRLF